MKGEELQIKNMFSKCCFKIVTEEIEKLGFEIKSIELGKVELKTRIEQKDRDSIRTALLNSGFELLSSRSSIIISKIKNEIVKVIHNEEGIPKYIKFSEYLAQKVGNDYSYLSNMFSQNEGITIEKYLIKQKIERIKELLIYDELSLNEIADILDYSSVQYLSNQFKDITGLSPSLFKNNSKNNKSD